MGLVWNYVLWGEWCLFALDLLGIPVAMYTSYRMSQVGWIRKETPFPLGTPVFAGLGLIAAGFHLVAATSMSPSRPLGLGVPLFYVCFFVIYGLMTLKPSDRWN